MKELRAPIPGPEKVLVLPDKLVFQSLKATEQERASDSHFISLATRVETSQIHSDSLSGISDPQKT